MGDEVDLGILGGDPHLIYSIATAINASGQIVGYYAVETSTNIINHVFLYQNGRMNDLGTLGGDAQAWSINNGGQIVGFSELSKNTFAPHAFLITNDVMVDLGTTAAATLS